MKFISSIIVISLLVALVPDCRAQERTQARPDTAAIQLPAVTAQDADSTLRPASPADTIKAASGNAAKPAVRRWDRSRIIVVSCIAALAIMTGVVAIKASYWPGGK